MRIDVDVARRRLRWSGGDVPCALGKGGVVADALKREGDGATPLGVYPLRHVLVRADRLAAPATGLPCGFIQPEDGWCDDPADAAYNRPVTHPYRASAERLWREDGLYDILVVLGHNDAPVRAGAGSAIFLHCCAYEDQGGLKPTLGCVAIARDALARLLGACDPGSTLHIRWKEAS